MSKSTILGMRDIIILGSCPSVSMGVEIFIGQQNYIVW